MSAPTAGAKAAVPTVSVEDVLFEPTEEVVEQDERADPSSSHNSDDTTAKHVEPSPQGSNSFTGSTTPTFANLSTKKLSAPPPKQEELNLEEILESSTNRDQTDDTQDIAEVQPDAMESFIAAQPAVQSHDASEGESREEMAAATDSSPQGPPNQPESTQGVLTEKQANESMSGTNGLDGSVESQEPAQAPTPTQNSPTNSPTFSRNLPSPSSSSPEALPQDKQLNRTPSSTGRPRHEQSQENQLETATSMFKSEASDVAATGASNSASDVKRSTSMSSPQKVTFPRR